MDNSYVAILRHKSVQWRVHFMAQDNKDMSEQWNEALKAVSELASSIEDSSVFYREAINLIGRYGFIHVMA